MAIKKTLLQIVQEILNDMDSEDVNSISDTLEAQQVASIVETTFYNLIATRDIPEHQELLKLTSLSDTSYPTHFQYPDNLRRVDGLWYDTSDDASFEYTKIAWCEPEEFLRKTDGLSSNYDSVTDKNGGTTLRIQNDEMPTFYTSFDDDYVIFNSYDSSIETNLQQSKIRGLGVVFPVFNKNSDSYVPDIDGVMFPYLINESKSVAMDLLKAGTVPKIEQAAKRQKSYVQNDRYKTQRPNNWSNYGR